MAFGLYEEGELLAVPDGQRAFSPAAIVTLSNRIRPAFRQWGRVAMGRHEMDVSLLIGAPLGYCSPLGF